MPLDTKKDPYQYSLTFGNGMRLCLFPIGNEAVDVIARLAAVMTLSQCSNGFKMFVHVHEYYEKNFVFSNNFPPGICILPSGINNEIKVIQMVNCAITLAFHQLQYGGILLHGALINKDGEGIILAGPGTVGKSTAARRVPPHWQALSDDATLVVKVDQYRYFAHPWPTWSCFYNDGTGGRWEVEKAIPLKAIFFLHQAVEDKTEPVDLTTSIAWLVESMHQVWGIQMGSHKDHPGAKKIYEMELRAAECLAKSVFVSILHISLTGMFWEKIDNALSSTIFEGLKDHQTTFDNDHILNVNLSYSQIFEDKNIPILYTGPSMNPVLWEGDILDVIPYNDKNHRIGDVICFHTPKKLVVHRIINMHQGIIQTQGDNNLFPDPTFQNPENIIGKVGKASSCNTIRNVHGGIFGRVIRRYVRIRRILNIMSEFPIIIARSVLCIIKKEVICIVPGIKLRIVLFSSPPSRIIRVFFGPYLAGEYRLKKGWTIFFPFQCVIDITKLPKIEFPIRLKYWASKK